MKALAVVKCSSSNNSAGSKVTLEEKEMLHKLVRYQYIGILITQKKKPIAPTS